MPLDYRTINVAYGEAIVLYDFLSDAQEAEAGIHTDDPVIQLAFWRLLGAIEREVISSIPDDSDEYEQTLRKTLRELREAAIGD